MLRLWQWCESLQLHVCPHTVGVFFSMLNNIFDTQNANMCIFIANIPYFFSTFFFVIANFWFIWPHFSRFHICIHDAEAETEGKNGIISDFACKRFHYFFFGSNFIYCKQISTQTHNRAHSLDGTVSHAQTVYLCVLQTTTHQTRVLPSLYLSIRRREKIAHENNISLFCRLQASHYQRTCMPW